MSAVKKKKKWWDSYWICSWVFPSNWVNQLGKENRGRYGSVLFNGQPSTQPTDKSVLSFHQHWPKTSTRISITAESGFGENRAIQCFIQWISPKECTKERWWHTLVSRDRGHVVGSPTLVWARMYGRPPVTSEAGLLSLRHCSCMHLRNPSNTNRMWHNVSF